MTRTRIPGFAPFFVFAAFLSLPFAGAGAQAQRPTLTVSTAQELLKAIGPNRVIQLKKGDYVLSSAYKVTGKYIDWYDSDEGKELAILRADGLTIRGVAGSRIVVDSPTAYLIDVQDSSGVVFDTLVFARKLDEGSEVNAGGIYLENCEDFTLSAASFEGPNGYLLELRDCTKVTVKKSRFMFGQYGVFYASGSTGLSFQDSTFSSNLGTPLLSLEECSYVDFRNCLFAENSGGTLVEIYAESGQADGITFTASRFKSNEFDYFSGPGPIPETDACIFDSNSFGEDWAEYAVAPEQDEEYYGAGAGDYATWYLGDSGLQLSYPAAWDVQEGEKDNRVGFSSPEGEVLVIFTALPTKTGNNANPAQLTRYFSDAAKAFISVIKGEAGIEVGFVEREDPFTDSTGLTSAWATGTGKKDNGGTGSVLARFVISRGKFFAIVAFVGDETLIEPGSEAYELLASLALEES